MKLELERYNMKSKKLSFKKVIDRKSFPEQITPMIQKHRML